jgi:hypothetical protein
MFSQLFIVTRLIPNGTRDVARYSARKPVPLRLKSIEQRGRDALWIRYEVLRSATAERRNNAKA